MKNPQVVPVLIDLLDDEEIAGYAVMALRKLKPPAARARLEAFSTHPLKWVRKEAQKAIEAIDRKRS